MKKKIVLTVALAGLAVTACGQKSAYRTVKNTGAMLHTDAGTEALPTVEATVEQKAVETLQKDQKFVQINESEDTQGLRENLMGAQLLMSENDKTETAKIEVSLLNKNSKDCAPQTITTKGFSQQALKKGLSIKGLGRVKCVEDDCNHLLLIVEKTQRSTYNGGVPMESVSGNVAVLLAKDEVGVFKPASSESEIIAKAQDLDESILKCIDLKRNQKIKEAYKQYGDSRSESAKNTQDHRLDVVNKKIKSLEGQLSGLKSNDQVAQKIQLQIETLKKEQKQLLVERQKQTYIQYGESRATEIKDSQEQKDASKVEIVEPVAE